MVSLGQCAETTARMLVVADGDGDKARATAADFAAACGPCARKPATLATYRRRPRPRADGRRGRQTGGTGRHLDNAGCGAPSDATFILAALNGLTDVVSGVYWDPVAVRFAARPARARC